MAIWVRPSCSRRRRTRRPSFIGISAWRRVPCSLCIFTIYIAAQQKAIHFTIYTFDYNSLLTAFLCCENLQIIYPDRFLLGRLSMSVQTAVAGGRIVSKSEERWVIFASSLGTVFEWYDFYLYAI